MYAVLSSLVEYVRYLDEAYLKYIAHIGLKGLMCQKIEIYDCLLKCDIKIAHRESVNNVDLFLFDRILIADTNQFIDIAAIGYDLIL